MKEKSIMKKHRTQCDYHTMEPVAKKRFLEDSRKRYSEMHITKKKELRHKQRKMRRSVSSIKKTALQTKRRKNRKESNKSKGSIESCIKQFNMKIREGPFLYAMFATDYYTRNQSNNSIWISTLVTHILTLKYHDKNQYICKTKVILKS